MGNPLLNDPYIGDALANAPEEVRNNALYGGKPPKEKKMGGLLNGLSELLKGFNTVDRFKKEGFDYRQKEAAQQAARDQELQNYQQQNEKYLLGQAEDVAAGQEGEYNPEEFASQIPGQIDQARKLWMAKQLPGRVSERKSSIAANNAYYKQQQDLLKGQQREREIALRGDEAESLTKLKNGLPLSVSDKAKLDAAAARTGQTIEGMLKAVGIREAGADRRKESGGGDEKPIYRYTTNQNGEAGTVLVFPGGREEFHSAAPTVTMRDTSGMAGTIAENIKDLKAAADPTNEGGGVTAGPVFGRISKIKQSMYPEGNEGVFDAKANQLVDIVYLKSGKQINQNEMKILSSMIPNRAKGNIDFQIAQFEDYANGLLRKYGKSVTGAPAGGAPAPGGKKRGVFNPATGQVEWK